MKEWLATRHRGLFIRSYLFLAGGLLVAAILLDLGFDALQSRQVRAADPWLVSTFRLMETELAAAPAAARAPLTADLSRRLHLEVTFLDAAEITGLSPGESQPRELVDDDGNIYYLWSSKALGGVIRLGPFVPPQESLLVRFVPFVFYGSILALVGLWLRPLLSDLHVLTSAAQKFAGDYREPTHTAAETTQLTSLATNLDDMSARVSQLIQSQKEMTAALSHEMRTPLARVRFAAAVLEGEVDESLRGQLRALNADVQQLDDLISDMLDYARLDHPGLRMEIQATPLEPWLRQVISTCPPHQKRVTTARADELEAASMEPRLMELAVSNLLANALRYAKQEVRVTAQRQADVYRIVVEDDGEGIPVGERSNVFRAFARLDTSRNRGTGGFGLGLAIVARIAGLHRGRAIADASAALGGARMSIEWPAA